MKKLVILSSLFLAALTASAQSVVSGTVVDKEGNPISNARVEVVGSTESCMTGLDGTFRMEVPDKAKRVKVRYVGMLTYTETIKIEPDMKIVLLEENIWNKRIELDPDVPFEKIHYVNAGVNANFLADSPAGFGGVLEPGGDMPGQHLLYGTNRPMWQGYKVCIYFGYEVGVVSACFSFGEEDLSKYSVQSMPMVGFQFGYAQQVSFGLHAGLYLGYDFHSTAVEYEENSFTAEEYAYIQKAWSPFDAGLFFGYDAWIYRFHFGIRCAFGLVDRLTPEEEWDLFSTKDMTGYHTNLYFTVGWRL